MDISIHALLAESDLTIMLYDTSSLIFLSTLSLRRATECFEWIKEQYPISIHALLAESDTHPITILVRVVISIHALLAESDFIFLHPLVLILQFLSTLSLRRATLRKRDTPSQNPYFYPRSPCGERPIVDKVVFVPGEFLSTLSLRRATMGLDGRFKL